MPLRLTPRRSAALLSAALTLLVTLLLSWALVSGRTPALLQRLDLWIYDSWVRTDLVPPAKPQVTVLELDEASLEAFGQWPWPRDRIAEIVQTVIDHYGAQVLAFDIVFAEPDRSDAAAIRQRLERVPPGADAPLRKELERLVNELDRDTQLAAVLQGRPMVLGYYFNADAGSRTGALPEPWLPAEMASELGVRAQKGAGYGANLEALVAAAGRAGHFNPGLDPDGVTRRIPLVIEHEEMLYPSLTLSVLTLLAGDKAAIDFGQGPAQAGGRGATEFINVGNFSLPINASAQALIPFFGGRGTLPRVSVRDVLAKKADPALLKDRVIVFGPTAPGLKDSRATPVDPNQPGVELHASMIQGAISGRLPSRPHYTDAAVLTVLWLVGLLMLTASRFLRPLPLTLASLTVAGAVWGGGWALWSQARAVLPVALPLTQVAALFLGLSLVGYLLETRSKNAINKLFGQYVPPELVGEMNEDPARYSMSARSTELTVMFADVRGFTTLSEKVEPAALGELMNQVLTELSRVVRADHLGTIDKYIGDCVMAFWGAPMDRADHAAAAAAAALDMQKALRALAPQLSLPQGVQIAVGIGLNTGKVVVGNMGSAYRMAYTVLGDTVNTASRLEGLTKAYGAAVVVGDAARQAAESTAGSADAEHRFLWRELDWVRVKGRDTPLAIHEPLCREAEATPAMREQVRLHGQALTAYRARRFDEALTLWRAAQQAAPSPLHEVWMERVRRTLEQPPPPDWDGVYTFETK